MRENKQLVRQFTRDFSLYACEWFRETLRNNFKKALGVGYDDYVIVGTPRNVTSYYLANEFETIRQSLYQKLDSDRRWFFQQSARFRRECRESRKAIARAVHADTLDTATLEQFRRRHLRLFPMMRLSILVPTTLADDIRSRFGTYGQRIIKTAYEDRRQSEGLFELNDYSLRTLVAKRIVKHGVPATLARYFSVTEVRKLASRRKPNIMLIKKLAKGYVLCRAGLLVNANPTRVFARLGYRFREERISGHKLTGMVAYRGPVVCGRVRLLFSIDQAHTFQRGEILVTPMTVPDFVPAMKQAKAIVTDEGGITCHAAIVSRELKKPCVIGTKAATRLFKDGDMVEVDAKQGVVRKL